MKQSLALFEWGSWAQGLVAAVIGGGSNGAIAALSINASDPTHFNAQTGAFWHQVWIAFGAGAMLGFFMYIAKNKLPEIFKTEVVGTKTVVAPSGETTTTVVQKTTTVETPPKAKDEEK